jgi:hypothetical protein
MIKEIKTIVKNYMDNADLSKFMDGTVEAEWIRINEKIVIPNELVVGNLKKTIAIGNKVRLLKNLGGEQYYILEVIE